jgi:hypothetical protein
VKTVLSWFINAIWYCGGRKRLTEDDNWIARWDWFERLIERVE